MTLFLVGTPVSKSMTDLLKDKAKLLEAIKRLHSEQKKSQSVDEASDLLSQPGVSTHDKLKIAIMMNHISDVQALLDIGAEPNGQPSDSLTPLQLALAYEREDIAELIANYLNLQKKPKPKA